MSTYLQMQDAVLAYGFDDSTYRARVKGWLNEAQAEIARSVEIPELLVNTTIAVSAGTSTYTKPTDLVRVKALLDESFPLQLQVAEYDDLLTVNNNGQTFGTPDSYALGSNILLSPIPQASATLRLLYYKDPTDLSADSSVSELPLDYHKAMVRYAIAEAYLSEDDSQMHAYHTQTYQRIIAQLGADKQQEVDDPPRQVPGTWGSW